MAKPDFIADVHHIAADSNADAITAGPPESEAGGILTVDLAALVANWRELGRRAMPSECASVIKANGYGCGIEQVATALARAGCKTFFVADLSEARRARATRHRTQQSMCSMASSPARRRSMPSCAHGR